VLDNVLAREFTTAQPDQAFATDITYIWTQESWLYLAVFIDLFSRRVVDWSMGSRMKAKLVTDALTMAIRQRQPKPGLIIHSDSNTVRA
jgi:transposase InsO family protein